MADGITRRKLVQRAAVAVCAPVLARGVSGCARRISPDRDVTAGSIVDGRLVVPRSAVPELANAGGAVVLHNSCAPQPVLLANTGTGVVALQAICPHAGCELAWVGEDRQAECPCHGSRFAGDGAVLNPPARTDLQAYRAEADPATGDILVHLFAGDGIFPAVQNGNVVFPVANYPALQQPGGAVLGQPEGLNGPMLVTRPTDTGQLVALSAICTHQQCTVQPVPAQNGSSLYCPCHGSRFNLHGSVTQGPATVSLANLPVSVDSSGVATVTVGSICS
jgi:Rieske Fe-S protein